MTSDSITPTSTFDTLGLAAPLLHAVNALGYTAPTAVQARTVPAALEGGDWMVSSQTGSGKTAAFLLPLLHRLLHAPVPDAGRVARPRAIVLCPTRELAQQVTSDAIDLMLSLIHISEPTRRTPISYAVFCL